VTGRLKLRPQPAFALANMNRQLGFGRFTKENLPIGGGGTSRGLENCQVAFWQPNRSGTARECSAYITSPVHFRGRRNEPSWIDLDHIADEFLGRDDAFIEENPVWQMANIVIERRRMQLHDAPSRIVLYMPSRCNLAA
jgi:hypothetical protein